MADIVSEPLKVIAAPTRRIVDSQGRELQLESNGALPVNIQDQTTEIIDLHLSQALSTLTLTIAASINDTSITGDVDAAFVPSVGEIVCLKEGTAFYQGEILGVTANGGDNYTLNLDTPLDYAFTLVGGCSIRNFNLAVDGSVTPVEFVLSPAGLQAGMEWDVVRVIFALLCDNEPDGTKFGDITGGLAKGLVLRVENGITKNIFNVKTNNDMAAHAYDLTYDDRAGPLTDYAVRMRRTFGGQSKNGVVIRLTADDDDKLVVIIQDDLTDLVQFQIIAQGHIATD